MPHAKLAARVMTRLMRDRHALLALAMMIIAAAVLSPALEAASFADRRLVVGTILAAFCGGALWLARSPTLNVESDSLRLVVARVGLTVVACATLASAAIGLLAT